MAAQQPTPIPPNWHKPSGKVADPLILVEGEDKAGKSYVTAELSRSPKIGTTFWIDLDDDTADEYGAIAGVDYIVAEHDGTYASVLARMQEAHDYAKKARANGEPPAMLVIDTWSAVWDGLRDWVTERAMNSRAGIAQRRRDPEAEVKGTRNQWNDARSRYNRMMNLAKTFPGVVILVARGKEISDTDPDTGQPYKDGRKTWTVEGEKNLRYDVGHMIRLTRTDPPLVVGSRNTVPGLGIRPGVDDPVVLTDEITGGAENVLEWFIFDHLKWNPSDSHESSPNRFVGGALTDDELVAAEQDGEVGPGQPPPLPAQRQQRPQPTQQQPALPSEDRLVASIDNAGAEARRTGSHDPLNAVGAWFAQRNLLGAVATTPMGRMAYGQYIDGWKGNVAVAASATVDAPAPAETPAEAQADDHVERALWLDELTGMAEVVEGPPVWDMLGVAEGEEGNVPVEAMRERVLALRPSVQGAMREAGLTVEADVYAQRTAKDPGPARWDALTAVPPALANAQA